MALQLTHLQKRGVESILGRVNVYLDARYQQIRRIQPKFETVWEDLVWQQTTNLRNTLAGDKAWGPQRFNVAEVMLGDDNKKIRDLMGGTPQANLMNEVVEEKESQTKGTGSRLEIHDMRTLYSSIDSSLANAVQLIQTFIWWDLEDGADLARFEKKVSMIRAFEENGITPEMESYYNVLMHSDKKLSADDVILYECKMLKRTVEGIRARRVLEPSYQMIIRRETLPNENPDALIAGIAYQMNVLDGLRRQGTIDDATTDQFAKAMGIEPGAVTPDKAAAFLAGTIAENKKRLKNALNGSGGGAQTNFKRSQLDELDARLPTIIKDRKVDE